MSTLRFSLVIPTRNRENTLPFTLQTCLRQDFDDYEVVVSDNCSTPATRALVDKLGDGRVRYVRSPTPLAMTDSLEFALTHASGEYVIFVGSDDGLLIHALPLIDEVLRSTQSRALRWESVIYHWPDLDDQEYAPPNRLLIPLTQVDGRYVVNEMDSRKMVQAAANSTVTYARLPHIYCSAIHRSLVQLVRERAGRVFGSRTPDVYASLAFGYVAGTYHSLAAPFSICGLSGRSTGVALYASGGKSPVAQEFRRANTEARQTRHPWVPELSVIAADVADAFLRAKEALFRDETELSLDRKQLLVNCLHQAPLESEAEWDRAREACRQSVADDHGLRAWFDGEYRDRSWRSIPRSGSGFPRRRYGGAYLNLDTSEFQVRDVAGAAALCERILGYRTDGLAAELRPWTPAERTESLTELEKKEAVIQQLKAIADERLRLIKQLKAIADERLRLIEGLGVAAGAKVILRRLAARAKWAMLAVTRAGRVRRARP